MALADHFQVDRLEDAAPLVRGWNIDWPPTGPLLDASAIVTLDGWVIGGEQRAVAVEAALEGCVLARAPISILRPDVAAAYPDRPGAALSGFALSVPVLRRERFDLTLQAVLADQSRAALARLGWRCPRYALPQPLVSVIIPCYRQAYFLAEAIASVREQTYPRVEIVVIDDGSPDNTAEICRRHPDVVYLRQQNAGLATARNTGIVRSRGEFLAFLDADDRLLPDAIAAGMRALAQRPECAFTYGRYRFIDFDGAAGATPPAALEDDCYAALLRRNYIGMHATALFRRSAVRAVDGYTPSFRACEDYDLYLRLARRSSFCRHGAVIAEYRRHGDNMTRNAALLLSSALAALEAQRPYAETIPESAAALAEGRRFWLEYYGQPLVEAIALSRRTGDWRGALRGLRTLARCDWRCAVSAALGRNLASA